MHYVSLERGRDIPEPWSVSTTQGLPGPARSPQVLLQLGSDSHRAGLSLDPAEARRLAVALLNAANGAERSKGAADRAGRPAVRMNGGEACGQDLGDVFDFPMV